MNASTISPESAAPAPRFDRKFIEDHKLIERYLQGQLPLKGARDLEGWLRSNPEYLDQLKLAERTQHGLKLLEAVGRPADLAEPVPPRWKSPYLLIALAAVAAASLLSFWTLFAKYQMLKGRLEDTRQVLTQGPLVQPTQERSVSVAPDHSPGVDHARIVVNHSAPELLDVRVDMAYTGKINQFRMFVDKKDQGRALVLNNLVKDSNNEIRLTLNSSGLAAGEYTARLEELPFKGSPIPIGWVVLEVR